jgi:hypothetical protein
MVQHHKSATKLYISLTVSTILHKRIQMYNRYSSVSIVNRLRAGRTMVRGSIPGRDRAVSFLHHIQTGSGAHTVYNPLCTDGSLAADKAAGA